MAARKLPAEAWGSNCRSQTQALIRATLPLRAPGFRPELRCLAATQQESGTRYATNVLPVIFSYASMYFARVLVTTSSGRLGPG